MIITLIIIIIITYTSLVLHNFTLIISLITTVKQQIQLILLNFILINIKYYYNNHIKK